MILIFAFCSNAVSEGLVVTVNTKTYNGEFAPKNAVAIWVMDLETNEYLSTILLATAATTYDGDELKNYMLYSGGENDYLPVDPARNDHTKKITARWDCVTYYDQLVWDGDFVVWVEFSEESTFDPSGSYNGKTVFDTITIDRTAGYATVTAPDTDYFTGFTITYDPSISIKSPLIKKDFNAGMQYFYNSNANSISVTCTDDSRRPSLLCIFDLKGKLVDRLAFDSKTVTWNMHAEDGRTVSTGTYLFEVLSNTGNRIGTVYPFTLVR